MYESNIDWILAIVSALAGIGIGALGYHLLNTNEDRNQKARQRLAETELELRQLKDAINDHFARSADLVSSIQRQSQDLEQQLSQGAERLCDDMKIKRRFSGSDDLLTESETPPAAPLDYADGGRGTLSEDFGLQRKEEEVTDEPQPPRH